ncbi:MAG TPA: ROK family protein [Bacillota bacterium]|nr:ROK family protein [Bacillota bacterium]
MFKLGIDLGGTKIKIIVLDGTNKVVYRERIPTEAAKGYEAILERIALLYRQTADRIDQAPHTLGMGIPGTISAKTGLVKNANMVCLNGKPLCEDLGALIKRPLAVQNDANCFTLAEALLGAAVGYQVVFGVIMGTGCGGGITFNGKVHSGIQGIAGEWGHMQIDPLGPQCYCGKRGCVETYISGGGLQQLYQERFGQSLTAQEIIAGYRSGKPDCSLIFQEFLGHFGTALANVIDVLDPDIVVLGGGLSNIPELYTLGRAEVDKQIFSDGLETPIVPNQLGDSAGVFGAAMIGI